MRFVVGGLISPVVLSLSLAAPATAQLITLRTVPLAQGDQFDIYPSQNSGMGGVSLALNDSLLDPFSNPAKGSRQRFSTIFSAPGLYSVSRQSGGGRTLPVGAMLTRGTWFGGVALALQEIDASNQTDFFGPILLPGPGGGVVTRIPEQKNGNAMAMLTLGRRLSDRLSLGGSVHWSRLHAVDGVDVMYAGSQSVEQFGGTLDGRFGVLLDNPGGASSEALVVHNRVHMTHDVNYLDFIWDPATQQPLPVARIEQNLDRTNTWGLHVAHSRPIHGTPWRLGWIATVNRMSHPKIPNYAIMNIPRDPGYSTALNIGMGVARRSGAETFGADFVYEPARSHTWAESATGARTFDNRFRFSNAMFRLGFNADLDPGSTDRGANMQLGLIVRAVRYRLDQIDYTTGTSRAQAEAWTDWTPTWGLGFGFSTIEIRYRGQVTHGNGRPFTGFGSCPNCNFPDAPPPPGGIIVAPSGPMNLEDVRVVTHHLSLSFPLR